MRSIPCLTLTLALASTAVANPRGAAVAFGTVGISEAGKVMTIDQSTDRAIINWQRFENTPTETIRFNQPAITSATLNRVVGVDPSVIRGALQSNGQLFLINPNGIVFDSTSHVSVGSLVASTLQITDADFKNNHYVLLSDPNLELSSVINRGRIDAQPGQLVALLAPIVDNSGVIVATAGRVIVKANRHAGIDTREDVSGAAAQGGSGRAVRMATVGFTPLLEDVVNTQGVVQANAIQRLSDGTVFLRGAGGIAVNGGTIDVNGNAAHPGGGTVTIDADRAIGFGPGSVVTAKGFGASAGTGQVTFGTNTGNVATSRAGGTRPAHAIVQAGAKVVSGSIKDTQSDSGGGLDLRAARVEIFGGKVGDTGKPVSVKTDSLKVTVEGNIDIAAIGDVTLDFVYTLFKPIHLSSTGSIFAGGGEGDTRGQPIVVSPFPLTATAIFLPPPPPPPILAGPSVAHVVGLNVTLDAAGSIGTVDNPLSVGRASGTRTFHSGTNQVFTVTPNIVAEIAPQAGASSGLVDEAPVPRGLFTPPTDPVEPPVTAPVAAPVAFTPPPVSAPPVDSGAPVAAPASTVGGRDNVLLPALRGTYSKNDTAAPSDSSGGMIEVVRQGGNAPEIDSSGVAAKPADGERSQSDDQVATRTRKTH